MGLLRNEEVRRLVKHLRERIQDPGRLAQIEDELSGEFAEEFIREPDLLIYFPELVDEFVITGARWQLRVIPHAHLRMVQHGIKLVNLSALFRGFVDHFVFTDEVITTGKYKMTGRPEPRAKAITMRADVDAVTDELGQAHVVTIYMGRSETEGTILIDPS